MSVCGGCGLEAARGRSHNGRHNGDQRRRSSAGGCGVEAARSRSRNSYHSRSQRRKTSAGGCVVGEARSRSRDGHHNRNQRRRTSAGGCSVRKASDSHRARDHVQSHRGTNLSGNRRMGHRPIPSPILHRRRSRIRRHPSILKLRRATEERPPASRYSAELDHRFWSTNTLILKENKYLRSSFAPIRSGWNFAFPSASAVTDQACVLIRESLVFKASNSVQVRQ